MKRTNNTDDEAVSDLSDQVKQKTESDKENGEEEAVFNYPGNEELVISTGSTLLDLAISGGRIRGGGIPAGIFVEIFGPSSSGKTVLLCEIAGGVQRAGGQVMFQDPEARLNKEFAQLFDLDVDTLNYGTPDIVPELFEPIREWEPETTDVINGVFADSLAALASDLEMEDKKDEYSRRAKLFSQELRKTCRVLPKKNFILVASNQLRDNMNAGPFGRKDSSPGGRALEYYASLRLRFVYAKKIKKSKTINGKKVEKVIGIETKIEVDKSSVWEPFHDADVTILFNYGIDDIRANLQFLKDYSKHNYYHLGGEKLHHHMSKSIRMVEKGGKKKVMQLREETIDLWEEIQGKFKNKRKPKPRFK